MKGSRVDMLPGIEITPRVMLEKCIERLPRLKHIILIEENQEGVVEIYCTKMTLGDAAWMKSEFDKRF